MTRLLKRLRMVRLRLPWFNNRRRLSIRWRLSLWYTSVLAATLALFGLLLYGLLAAQLFQSVDDQLVRQAQHVTGTLMPHGMMMDRNLVAFASPDTVTLLFTADGEVVASTAAQASLSPQVELARLSAANGKPQIRTVDRDWRVWVGPLTPNSQVFLQVTTSLATVHHTLRHFAMWLISIGWLAILLALLIGLLVAESALQPLAVMTETARAIAAGRGFHRRIEVPNRGDELSQLATTFNEMLASLAEAYDAQQRFVADASHELRAPLTVIRGNLHLLAAEQAPGLSPEEKREVLADTQAEAERMSRLIDDLLALARADAGATIAQEQVELDRLLVETLRPYQRRSQGGPVALRLTHIEPVTIIGDPERLKQLVVIFLDNAFRYTPAGEVRVSLQADGVWAKLTVADTGIGIPAADLPHIFERFYRADKARSRTSGGTGLGLSIARWIVDRHGGTINVRSQVGQGTVFEILLPRMVTT
jgi:signal transduction histidine kinase